jgi:hypothetical protein
MPGRPLFFPSQVKSRAWRVRLPCESCPKNVSFVAAKLG